MLQFHALYLFSCFFPLLLLASPSLSTFIDSKETSLFEDPELHYTLHSLELLKRGNLFFLHPHKTGSSFANLFLSWSCPQLDLERLHFQPHGIRHLDEVPKSCIRRWKSPLREVESSDFNRRVWFIGEHYTLGPERDPELLRSVFFTIREPRSRFVSAVLYFGRGECDANAYINHHNFEVKLNALSYFLLGRDPLNASDVAESCSLINRLGFIGDVDYYEASVCLFAHLYGGRIDPMVFENTRPARPDPTHHSCKAIAESTLNATHDFFDLEVYRCARQRFLRDIHYLAPHCAELLVPQNRSYPPMLDDASFEISPLLIGVLVVAFLAIFLYFMHSKQILALFHQSKLSLIPSFD